MATKYKPVDNNIDVENTTVYGTRDNDIFHIKPTTSDNVEIVPGNQATDSLYFDMELDYVSPSHLTGTKDLIITYASVDPDADEKTLIIKNWFSSKNATAAKSSLKNIHYVWNGNTYNLSILEDLLFTDLYTTNENKHKVTGSNFADYVNLSAKDSSYTVNGGNGNDYIIGTDYNDTLNGGNGDDYIYGKKGDDVLTGGKGTNTYNYDADISANGNDTINLTKGETAKISYIGNLSKAGYKLDGKGNALIYFDNTDAENNYITLKDFAKKDLANEVKFISPDKVENLKDTHWYYAPTGDFNGTYLNEHIDAKGIINPKTDKKGKTVAYSFKTGKGNDIIESTNFADKITAGIGENEIRYTSLDQLDGDMIYLTKNENLTIDLTGISENNATATYTLSGKNLVVTVSDGISSSKSFTIADFGTKDITGVNGGVILKDKNGVTDLKEDAFVVVDGTKGTFHNDVIKQDGYKIYKTVKIGNTKIKKIETDVTKKGLNIASAAGNDSVIGSNYSDTIKGAAGDDTISGGTGNDKLYGESGENTFVFKAGDGADTVYGGDGVDTLEFSGISMSTLQLSRGTDKNNKNDLIIKYSENDYVTVKDYYAVNAKTKLPATSVKYITTTEGTFYIDPSKIITGEGEIEGDNNANFISGSKIADTIRAFDGDDTIYSGAGNDVIYGGAGADSIIGDAGNDSINGEDGDDYIGGSAGDDSIHGGDGDDEIYGGDGADTIYGGADADYIDSGADADSIEGGDGDDEIYGGDGADTIYGGAGTDYIEGGADADSIEGGDGDDEIYGGDGADTIYGGAGADYIEGGADADYIEGGAGNDTINGGIGYDIIYGGDGNDTIYGDSGRDTIYGGDGDDYIYGGDGQGDNDDIYSGTGNDTIYGGGGYSINSMLLDSGDKTIESGAGGLYDILVFLNETSTSNLIGHISGNDLVVSDSTGTSARLKNYFTEGHRVELLYVQEKNGGHIGVGELPIEIISGESEINGTDLKDRITATNDNGVAINGYAGNDTINGGAGNDTIDSGAGNDLIDSGAGDDIIDSGAGNDTIYAGEGNDVINGGAGNDTIYSGDGADTIDAGTGGNLIYLGAGNKTIINGSGNDTLTFSNETSINSLMGLTSGNDLIINDSKGNLVTLSEFFSEGNSVTTLKVGNNTKTIENFLSQISNNVIIGTLDDDTINGGAEDDIIYCRSGNDTVNGGTGSNIIYLGKGNKTIINGGGVDTLVFNDKTNLNNIETLISGDDLVINDGDGNSITLSEFFSGAHSVKNLKVGNAALAVEDLIFTITSDASTISGTNYRDSITATNDSSVVINGYAGNDTIYGGAGNDVINGGAGNDTIYGNAGDDSIIGDAGNDIIYGGAGNDSISGNDGNDILYGNDGDDTIDSGAGNDTVNGGLGTNLLYLGAGSKTIINGGGADTLVFSNETNINNITAVATGNNLVLSDTSGTSAILVDYLVESSHNVSIFKVGEVTKNINELKNYIESDAATIYGSSFHDSITATTDTYHMILAGAGDDVIHTGNATNRIEGGDGNDTIYGGSGWDNLYGEAGDDLIYGGETYDTINGGDGNDTIYGDGGADAISGDGGNDELYGESGDDTINGGDGKDTISGGDGNDSISGGADNDSIEGGEGNDTIKGNEGDDLIYGDDGDDDINGNSGKDTIYGGIGKDNINGDDGDDELHGGTGDDTIKGSGGSDLIYGGVGNDSLNGGDGNDEIYGENDDDIIDGGSGNDELYGGSGSDSYILSDLLYYDVIYDEAGINDSIKIGLNKAGIILRFDVKVDEYGAIIENDSKNMYITNTADFGNAEKGVKVINQFMSGRSIEEIQTTDGILMTTQINELRENIAGWLHDGGFTSVQQILDSHDETAIGNLLAEFQKADWQQLNV